MMGIMTDEAKREQRRFIFQSIYGVLITCVLVFAMLTLNENINNTQLYVFLMFLSLTFSHAMVAVFAFLEKSGKIAFWKRIGFSIAYLAAGILAVTIPPGEILFSLIGTIYLSTVAANRICVMIEKKKVLSIIFNSLLVLLCLIFIISGWGGGAENAAAYLMLILFLVIIVSLLDVLAFSFAKIQMRGLIKIIRKTYVVEILYGLLILVVSFSFYFTLMEPSITNMGDALWYSFAIITTIGFGDMTTTSIISRILSVILGFYGLIVTATITSVIVNFYNETKNSDKEEPKAEEKPETEKKPEEIEGPKDE